MTGLRTVLLGSLTRAGGLRTRCAIVASTSVVCVRNAVAVPITRHNTTPHQDTKKMLTYGKEEEGTHITSTSGMSESNGPLTQRFDKLAMNPSDWTVSRVVLRIRIPSQLLHNLTTNLVPQLSMTQPLSAAVPPPTECTDADDASCDATAASCSCAGPRWSLLSR